MTWNHRVVHRKYDNGEETFGVYEVFYDDDGNPDKITTRPVEVMCDSVGGVRQTLEWMTKALRESVLEYSDFEEGGKYYG